MQEGWIKLHRKLMDAHYYHGEPFCRPMAWVDLLMLANHKDGVFRVRGIRVEIKRGQVGATAETLGKRWTWSKGKVLRFLNELQIDTQIDTQKTNVTTLITILNYDEYQGDGTQNSTQTKRKRNTDRSADGTQTDLNNNDKNNKNVNNEEKVFEPSASDVSGTSKKNNKATVPLLKMEESWNEHLQKNCGISYYAGAAERQAMKQIRNKLLHQVKERHKLKNEVYDGEDDKHALDAWRLVLTHYPQWSDFNKKFSNLTQINGQLNNIIADIKRSAELGNNGASNKNGNGGLNNLKGEALAIVKEVIG